MLEYHKNIENKDICISILFESFTLLYLSEGIKRKTIYLRKAYNLTLGDNIITGKMNDTDLKEGIVIPIEKKVSIQQGHGIYTRMNHIQKKSVYKIPSYMEPIK